MNVWIARHRLVLGLTLALFAIVLAVLAAILLRQSTPDRPAPAGSLLVAAAEGDNVTTVLARFDAASGVLTPLDMPGDLPRDALSNVSPDGAHYWTIETHWHEELNANQMQVWVAASDGSDARPLTDDGHFGTPVWSPDGERLVFTHSVNYHSALFVAEVETGALTQLTGYQNDIEPSWSPDGSRILFTTSRDGFQELYTMAPDGSDLQRLTDNEQINDFAARWSPDGEWIAFQQNYAVGDGSSEVWIMRPDGSGKRQITDNNKDDHSLVWSPDSRSIAFVRTTVTILSETQVERTTDIYVYDLKRDRVRRLTDHPDYDGSPVWSPDSMWIAFRSHRDTPERMYLIRADGSGLRPLDTANPDAPHITAIYRWEAPSPTAPDL
ncbi:MAG TPA: hypothetical protein PKD09_15835 [Aggregatilinea sp.]|uniref:TolB family protein n=1 Tax=Aggregatilinea sp. TaxID=2806333 RepID=UPI002BC5E5C9|nr:hypothetical protein [Aggregatilinea sp.]HML23124.1 hypothetical protein [Aggregatilinea sp.]